MAARSNFFSVLSRIWFPIALVVLFVLALPGLMLFVLHLAGLDAEANEWLQDNFNLRYRLALPWGFALVLLLLPFLVVLLYFLKLKRKALEVPSTFLWKKSIEDLHVNSLFQWLRHNILLLLQLLILVVLIYAVMGFRVYGNVAGGRHYIVMIDNSASMAATDLGGTTRLEWAKEQALNEIDAAAESDVGMVVEFNSKATTLQSYTSNRGKLKEAVRSIQQTQRVTRIEEALKLADSLANPLQSTEDVASRPEDEKPGQERSYVPTQGTLTDVYLYSDGKFPDLPDSVVDALNSRQSGNTSALGNLRIHFLSIGKPGRENVDNIGIVLCSARRLTPKSSAPGKQDADKLFVQVTVHNYRPTAATNLKLHLDVYVDDKEQPVRVDQETIQKLAARTVAVIEKDGKTIVHDVPGEQEVTFTLPAPPIAANVIVHAKLFQMEDGRAVELQDDFRLDNEAKLALSRPRKARVLIVGAKNEILDIRFGKNPGTLEVATVQKLAPQDLDTDAYRRTALNGEFDLVIFDRCTPKKVEDMPQANTLFLDQVPPPWRRAWVPAPGQKGEPMIKGPRLMVSQPNHPLLNVVNLKNVFVTEIFRFDVMGNLAPEVRDDYTLKPREGKKPLPQVNTLIETANNVPVLFGLARGSYTDLVLTVPLVDDKGNMESWAVEENSFPQLLWNVLETLGNIQRAGRADKVQPGDVLLLRPEAVVQKVEVTTPSKEKHKLERAGQPYFTFHDTEQVGIYTVAQDDGLQRKFAVNLLDSAESNIEPRTAFDIGDERIVSGRERPQAHDFWKWVVVAAVLLLLLEWYVYNRRVFV